MHKHPNLGIINYKFCSIFINFGSFVMMKLISFDKIFENSAGIVSLLAMKLNSCSYQPNTPIHVWLRFSYLGNTKNKMFIH